MEAELIQRQRKILADAAQLVADLADNRAEIQLEAKLAASQQEFQIEREAIKARRQAELETAETEYRAERDRVTAAAQKAIDEIESAYRQTSETATSAWQQEQSEAERIKEDTHFEITGVYEAGKNNLKSKYGDLESGTDSTAIGIESRRKEIKQILKTHGQEGLAEQPGQPIGQLPGNVNPQQAIEEAFKVADAKMAELKAVKRPKGIAAIVLFFCGGRRGGGGGGRGHQVAAGDDGRSGRRRRFGDCADYFCGHAVERPESNCRRLSAAGLCARLCRGGAQAVATDRR